ELAAPTAQSTYPTTSLSGEPPTAPGAPTRYSGTVVQEPAASTEPPTRPGAPAQDDTNSAAVPSGFEPTSTTAPGSYAQGVLPPIFSPFANQPAPAGNATEAEPEKPAKVVHHRTKKAEATSGTEEPAGEEKQHKAVDSQV